MRKLKVALLGAGSVGSQVARLLVENNEELSARCGAQLELIGVAVRKVGAQREYEGISSLETTNVEQLINQADIIIELIGGIEPAKKYIELALSSAKPVVTANKALLAEHGSELFELANRTGSTISYEASVAAAIPIMRPLKESLSGDKITKIMGIVNGSTNYILDRMHRYGDSAENASKLAYDLGFLEADPTLDVEGYDAASKVALLARLAFHTNIPADAVYREGITQITAEQVNDAKKAGYVIKLLGIAEQILQDDGAVGVSARVYPALIDKDHPLAAVHEGKNAIFVDAEAAGSLMFYGAGAGGNPTASAVLGDLVSAVRQIASGRASVQHNVTKHSPIVPLGLITTKYRLTLIVTDKPGVLAKIAEVFAKNGVSLESVQQSVNNDSSQKSDIEIKTARLVIGTHEAYENELAKTVAELAELDVVINTLSVLRVEGK